MFENPKIHKSYIDFFERERAKDYFKSLCSFLSKEYTDSTIYPGEDSVFRALELTPLGSIKVVILGQDPYHGVNQADGLAFSASKAPSLPPSLRNILKEISTEYRISHCNSDLSWLAKQGVMLLNTILTVRDSEPLSHSNIGWESFTDNLIAYIASQKQYIAYMLWGANARSKKSIILANSDSKYEPLIIENVHPSPLSANRGFFNSNMFVLVNNYLLSKDITPITW